MNKQIIINSVNIRIVSGDHIKRTKFAAEQCGFVNEEQMLGDHGVFMSGREFRQKIGNYSEKWNPETKCFDIEFAEPKRIRTVKKKLRIISRATAEDKKILAASIKNEGGMVLITGETI